MHKRIDKVLQQWSVSWRDALIASIGGAVAAYLSVDARPAAPRICNGYGRYLPRAQSPQSRKTGDWRHYRRDDRRCGWRAFLLLPETIPVLHMSVVTCIAMVLATTFGLAPAIAIQSGVSAILVRLWDRRLPV